MSNTVMHFVIKDVKCHALFISICALKSRLARLKTGISYPFNNCWNISQNHSESRSIPDAAVSTG